MPVTQRGDQLMLAADRAARAAYDARMDQLINGSGRPQPSPPRRAGGRRPSRARPREAAAPESSQSAIRPPDLGAGVLLEEVGGAGDHVVDLATERGGEPLGRSRAGAPGRSRPTGTAWGGGPSRSASSTRCTGRRAGRVGLSGRISGKARAPAFDGGVGERRVVGGDHLVAGVALARAGGRGSRPAGPRCARRSRETPSRRRSSAGGR